MEDGKTRKQWKIFLRKTVYFPLNAQTSRSSHRGFVPKSASSAQLGKVLLQTVEISISYSPTVCQLNLALSLLMALVFRANNHNFSVSLDDLALVAHGLDGRTYFHSGVLLVTSNQCVSGERPQRAARRSPAVTAVLFGSGRASTGSRPQSGFAAPGDPALRQIVRAHLQLDGIAFDDADIIHSQLTGNIRRNDVAVGQPDFERALGRASITRPSVSMTSSLDILSSEFTGSEFRHRLHG